MSMGVQGLKDTFCPSEITTSATVLNVTTKSTHFLEVGQIKNVVQHI